MRTRRAPSGKTFTETPDEQTRLRSSARYERRDDAGVRRRAGGGRVTIAAAFLLLLQAVPAPAGAAIADGSVTAATARLRAGQFLWAPQASPGGPMLMVVNLQTQRAAIYRNGVPIGITTVSTGRKGHETPTGIYVVLQKDIDHRSSLYDDAPMPFMQRLTWDGIALHGGALPGYPASHGCIRLPLGFARLLYGETRVGMTVIVTRLPSMPPMVMTDAEMLDGAGAPAAYSWHPERAESGPLSILVSGADRQARVIRNGREIGAAPVTIERPVTSPIAYVLQEGGTWLRIGLMPETASTATDAPSAIGVDPAFRRLVLGVVRPGTTVVVTPDPLRPDLATTAALLAAPQDP